jgi:hypothetical protein
VIDEGKTLEPIKVHARLLPLKRSPIINRQSSIINQIGLASGVMNGRARSFAGSGIAQVVV